MNDDDAVTVADLDVVAGFVAGAPGGDYGSIADADVDGDGDIDARDALIIHAFIEGEASARFRVGDIELE